MNEKLNTKFGTARISNEGYYQITSGKEGNNGKYLHRLIWEYFYGCEIPDGYVIHHKNSNKLDNCILNLQLMSESDHHKLHWENISEETRQKMSKTRKQYWNSEDAPKRKQKQTESMKEYWNSEEGQEKKQKISEAKKNNFATINKNGFKKNGKQNYALRFNGKILKKSVNPNKLLEYFLINYLLEIIKIPEWLEEV